MIEVLTNIKHIDETQDDYEEYDAGIVYNRDLIANLRSLITSVCSECLFNFFFTLLISL